MTAIGVTEEAVAAMLNADATLAALVSTRIYPQTLPQSVTLPAVTYIRIAGPSVKAMGSDPGLEFPTIQVTAHAKDVVDASGNVTTARYTLAKQVAKAVRGALSRKRGTFASIVVQDVLQVGDRDDFDPAVAIARVMTDFQVWAQAT